MNAFHSLSLTDRSSRARTIHKPHSPSQVRRHPRIEQLESRIALNADPSAAGAAMQNAAAASSAGANAAAGPTEFRQATAAPSPAANQPTDLDLLFDPHQPKSGLPADVTSGIGPASQQGAPPRISYNLEDNITGGDHSGQEALLGPLHAPDSPINSAGASVPPNVANTPYGVPNFGFGPDTWVFGSQAAGPPEARTARRPLSPADSGISPDLRNSAPPRDEPSDSAPDDDRGASLPQDRPISQPVSQSANPPSEALGLGDFDDDGPGADALEGDPPSAVALTGKAVDRLIADDNSLGQFDAARPHPWPAASAIAEPDSDPSDVLVPAVVATGLLAPAAGGDRSGPARNPPHGMRGWSRPVRRLRR
ncbi:MAG TPA: hypothetical protein VGN42_24235 [Pirellulales bacterium]|nr:hypothetical protein [Pirellulales bacterium]